MEAEFISVGQRVPEWAVGTDGCVMEYHSISGLTLMYFLNNPTREECHVFETSQNFRISFTSFMDVGFFSFKVGDLEWSDCAFSPNLYSKIPEFPLLASGHGYTLNLMLIDAATGEIKSIRLIGLGHKFSCQFRDWCLNSLQKDISNEIYHDVVTKAFERFTTKELVKRAFFEWEL